MSNDHRKEQEIHYHYHFYGVNPQQIFGPGAQASGNPAQPADPAQAGVQGNPGGFAPQGPAGGNPFGASGAPFGVPPGAAPQQPFQAGAPQPNAHQHPTADSFIKGLLVGGGAAYLLTNETAQRTILRTAVQLWSVVQGGFEELKERLHDAEAEVAAADESADIADDVQAAAEEAQEILSEGADAAKAAADGARVDTPRFPRTVS